MPFLNIPISDSHIHVFWDGSVDKKVEHIKGYIRRNKLDSVIVQSIPHSTTPTAPPHGHLDNLNCLYYKTMMPDNVFAFAGFHHKSEPCANTKEYYLEMA